ncbi:hypothetical protein Acr_15g0006200 [Actinidia rufa]|uniref:Retrotransposon Copia-like N-terminal domain-containing protein n=1 Tax=Actinidia rufa TaxID=165716 RepID=A0A7J0FTJ7_9ERIC|nr:hypothetical protein Acr_15g0006200 [Actinidia rufa]
MILFPTQEDGMTKTRTGFLRTCSPSPKPNSRQRSHHPQPLRSQQTLQPATSNHPTPAQPCANTPLSKQPLRIQQSAAPVHPLNPCAANPMQPAVTQPLCSPAQPTSSSPAARATPSCAVQPSPRGCPSSYGPEPSSCPISFLRLILGVITVMADSLKEVAPAYMVPSPVLISLSHSQPPQCVTSVLLNGKNFHAWSRSFQLYLGRKRKIR